MRVLASLLLLLTSCATTSPPTRAVALSRFDGLLQFLPDDMQSYWLSDLRDPDGDQTSPGYLTALAGRDFEAPHSANHGEFAFVEVTRPGTGDDPPRVTADELCTPDAPIGAHPVWRSTQSAYPTATQWLTIVDDRYLVRASSRDLLTKALTRSTRREALVRGLPDCAALRADAQHYLLLRPRPQPEQAPHYRPELRCAIASPTMPLLVQCWESWGDSGGPRVQVLAASGDELSRYLRSLSTNAAHSERTHAVDDVPGVHAFEIPDQRAPMLLLCLLFGQHLMA